MNSHHFSEFPPHHTLLAMCDQSRSVILRTALDALSEEQQSQGRSEASPELCLVPPPLPKGACLHRFMLRRLFTVCIQQRAISIL